MPYEFFLSYSRSNNDAFLKKFFDDLSEEIRGLRGLPQNAPVGFFDQRELALGDDWDNTIVEALQTSSIFLAVTSPGYFKSEYCGKEWALFRARLAAAAGGGQPAPLLKPVIWIPFDIMALPAAIRTGQLTLGDPQAIQNTLGFRRVLKNLTENQIAYNNLVAGLAQEIVHAADQHAVQRLAVIPKLSAVDSAFTMAPGAGANQPAATGPKHIRFVYVAASPAAFGAVRSKEAYVDAGGADWKPYYPDDKTRIHRLVQNFVSNDDLDFTSEELAFGPNLVNDIIAAWDKRQIVVLIVDGWSVQWDANSRNILTALDGRLDYHWCVLVPYNENDQDSMGARQKIDDAMRVVFDRHAILSPNPLFFRDKIKSVQDFKTNLRDVLTRLKEEIKKRAPVDMPVPVGPSKTVVTGPSAQGNP